MIRLGGWLGRHACRIWLTRPLRAAGWYRMVRVGDIELGAIIHRRK